MYGRHISRKVQLLRKLSFLVTDRSVVEIVEALRPTILT